MTHTHETHISGHAGNIKVWKEPLPKATPAPTEPVAPWSLAEDQRLRLAGHEWRPSALQELIPGKSYNDILSRQKFLRDHAKVSALPTAPWQAPKPKGPASKHKLNRNQVRTLTSFFYVPTPLSAYYAGFIAADGCIRDDGTVNIKISSKDRDWLQVMADHLKPGFKVKTRARRRGNPCCDMHLSPKGTIARDLYRWYNITPRKSNTLQPPHNLLDPVIIRCFIAGYLDGDGGFSYKPSKGLRSQKGGNAGNKGKSAPGLQCCITGTESLIKWIDQNVPGVDANVYPVKGKKAWRYHCSTLHALHFAEYIKPQQYIPDVIMQRKWELPTAYRLDRQAYGLRMN